MKQRRPPTRRKQVRQPRKKLYPQASPAPSGEGPFHTDTSLGAAWQQQEDEPPVELEASGHTEPVPVAVNDPTPTPQQYAELLSRIAVLERLVAELPNQRPGVGHNRPPIGDADVQEITQAVAILKHEPVAPDKAGAVVSTLKKVGERLGTYLDTFLLEASKSAGKEFGKKLVQLSYWAVLYSTLMNLVNYVDSIFRR
jgi:hypothetical protein